MQRCWRAISLRPIFRAGLNSKHPLCRIADDPFAPPLVQAMLQAAAACNVGPMASVAGAVADFVGSELLKHSGEVIVENGGDIFFKISRSITVGIFAGASPLSERVG